MISDTSETHRGTTNPSLSWTPSSPFRKLATSLGYGKTKTTSSSDEVQPLTSADPSNVETPSTKKFYTEPKPPDNRKYLQKHNFMADAMTISIATITTLLFAAAMISPPSPGTSQGLVLDGTKSLWRGLSSVASWTVEPAWKGLKWALSEALSIGKDTGCEVSNVVSEGPSETVKTLMDGSIGSFGMRETEKVIGHAARDGLEELRIKGS